MKVTKENLAVSKKLRNLENEMSQILEDSGKMSLIDLKSNFKYRASVETVRHIADLSNKMNLRTKNMVRSDIRGHGDITYTMEGKNIKSIHLGKCPGNVKGDTLPSVPLYGNNYEFELRVISNLVGTWTFTVTEIRMDDGKSYRKADPITNDGDLRTTVTTYPKP